MKRSLQNSAVVALALGTVTSAALVLYSRISRTDHRPLELPKSTLLGAAQAEPKLPVQRTATQVVIAKHVPRSIPGLDQLAAHLYEKSHDTAGWESLLERYNVDGWASVIHDVIRRDDALEAVVRIKPLLRDNGQIVSVGGRSIEVYRLLPDGEFHLSRREPPEILFISFP